MSFMPLLENEEEGLSWASRACGLGFLGFRDWVIDPRVSEGGVWRWVWCVWWWENPSLEAISSIIIQRCIYLNY